MLFSKEVNQSLQKNQDELHDIRENIKSGPPDSLYAVHFDESNEGEEERETFSRVFYSRRPPLIGYRYRIPQETSESVMPKFFMNDIVLLHLEESDARQLSYKQMQYPPTRSPKIVRIDTLPKLRFYLQPGPGREILVKGLNGQLVSNHFRVEQLRRKGWSYYLLFILDGEK